MITVLMVLAMAAADNPTARAPAPTVTAGSSNEDLTKIKCVRQAPTGTRFEKRVCKTLSEWYRQGKAAQSDLKQIQDRTITHTCKGTSC